MEEEKIILDNIPLIYECIKKLHLTWETEDEWQEYYDNGLVGLIKGAKSFDKSKNFKLSTFLMPCIMNEIKHLLVTKTRTKRHNKNGRDVSLNAIVGDAEDSELSDFIEDTTINIEEEVEKKLQIEAIIKELDSMENKKDVLVFKMYYGLNGYTPKSYEEISQVIGVSRERIRQRINRVFNKLKEKSKFIERKVFMEEEKPKIKVIPQQISTSSPKPSPQPQQEPKNTLLELNNILFDQLNKLKTAEEADFEKEIRKSYAISQLAQQIVANTNTCIKAIKLAKTENIDAKQLNFVGINEK